MSYSQLNLPCLAHQMRCSKQCWNHPTKDPGGLAQEPMLFRCKVMLLLKAWAVSFRYQCTLNSQVFWPCFLLFSLAWCRPWLLTPFQLLRHQVFFFPPLFYIQDKVYPLFSQCVMVINHPLSVSAVSSIPLGSWFEELKSPIQILFLMLLLCITMKLLLKGKKACKNQLTTISLKNKTLLISIR